MMRTFRRLVFLIASVAGLLGCMSNGPQELRYNVGRAVSTRILESLVNQHQSQYKLALINATVGTALLISSPGETPQAESIRGHENWLWAQAAEQLAGAEQISLQTARHHLDAANCPALPRVLNAFFAEAEPVLASQFVRFPPRKDLSTAASDGVQEIVIDGASYLLQVVAADSAITFTIANRTDSELLHAVAALSSSIGECTIGLEPEIERIYGLF